MQVPGLKKKILIANQLVSSICAELDRTAQGERLQIESARAKGGPSVGHAKERAVGTGRPENAGSRLQARVCAACGASAEALKDGLVDHAAARYYRIVLAEIGEANGRDSLGDTGIVRDRSAEFEVSAVAGEILAGADLGEGSQRIADIDASSLAHLKILRQAIALAVDSRVATAFSLLELVPSTVRNCGAGVAVLRRAAGACLYRRHSSSLSERRESIARFRSAAWAP